MRARKMRGPGRPVVAVTLAALVSSLGPLPATGAVIDVAAGTYVENVVVTTPSVLTIRGTGAGLTIVDGNAAGTVIAIQNQRLTLSGVTLQNGSASFGGGLHIESFVRLTVADSEITGNTAPAGSGMFVAVRANVTLDDVVVDGNTGAAIYLDSDENGMDGPKGTGSRLTINGGAVRNNTAGGDPAISGLGRGNNVSLTGVAIDHNTATFQENGAIDVSGKVTIDGCEIFENPVPCDIGAYEAP